MPLVTDARDPDARREIEAEAAAVGAPFIAVDEAATIESLGGARYGQSFAVTTASERYEISLPVLGGFQQRNAATAIVALETLDELRPTRAQVENGLAQLVIPGRLEFFPSHPSVAFDVAHNPDKAANLVAALAATFPNQRFSFVIAIEQSKDVVELLRPFAILPATFTFTSFDGVAGRTAVRPQRLASIAEDLGLWGRAIADPVDAFSIARRNADAADIVVVTGSTFVVATLREWWIANVVHTGV